MSGSSIASIILSGVAGQQPLYDPLKAQQIQGNRLALLQQEGQVKAQNALAKLYADPKNVQGGMLTPNALAQIMGIDATTGMQIAQQQDATAKAGMDLASAQHQYLADNIASPAMEAYETALKTMPPTAAAAYAQKVYSDGLNQAKSSGLFSADQVSLFPNNFDPIRVGSNLLKYQDWITAQQGQEKIDVDQTKNQIDAFNAGYTLPGGAGGTGGGAASQPSSIGSGNSGSSQGPVNNPGNLRVPGSTTAFQQFPTLAAGYQAMAQQLQLDAAPKWKGGKGLNTLATLIPNYAPPNENDTAGYIRKVSNLTGIDPNAPLNMNDPATLARVQTAMAAVEGAANLQQQGGSQAAAQQPLPTVPGYSQSATQAMVDDYISSQGKTKPDFGTSGMGRRQNEAFMDAVGIAEQNQSANGGGLDPALAGYTKQAMDLMTQTYKDSGVVPSFGSGAAGQAARRAFMNYVASQGITAPQVTANKATYKADTASLANLTKLSDAADAFDDTFTANEQVLKSTLPAAQKSLMPWVNRWVQEGDTFFGDPSVPPYVVALMTTMNEYARITSGATGSAATTEGAREEALSILPPNFNTSQALGVLEIANKDVQNKKASYLSQIAAIQARLGNEGGTAPPADSSSAPASPSSPEILKYDANGNLIQ